MSPSSTPLVLPNTNVSIKSDNAPVTVKNYDDGSEN